MDRQIYQRSVKRSKKRRAKAQQVVELVEDIRMKMPKIGGRKLYFMLNEQMRILKIGRNKFFDILRAKALASVISVNFSGLIY